MVAYIQSDPAPRPLGFPTRVTPTTDILPDGITLEQDGDLIWVSLFGRRMVSAASHAEALHHAVLLTAFEVRSFRFGGGATMLASDAWPEMGAFRGPVALAHPPERVKPSFRIHFDWTYRLPTFRVMVGADYASWRLWRLVRRSPQVSNQARQTDPVLSWCYYFICPNQTTKTSFIRLGDLTAAIKRMKKLIEVLP